MSPVYAHAIISSSSTHYSSNVQSSVAARTTKPSKGDSMKLMVATFQTYVKGTLAKIGGGQVLLNILRTLEKTLSTAALSGEGKIDSCKAQRVTSDDNEPKLGVQQNKACICSDTQQTYLI